MSDTIEGQHSAVKKGSRLSLYISAQLRQEVATLAKEAGLSMAQFARGALESYLKAMKQEKRNEELKAACEILER